MRNRIWIWWETFKAETKDALGLKLTEWEDFIIRIGLY